MREVARCVVGGELAGVELVLDIKLDGVVSEGDGACGGYVWVYVGDAGNEEIGAC